MMPETPNHVCLFELKGSGLSHYAECSVCGEKLCGGSGPIVGSRARVSRLLPQEGA